VAIKSSFALAKSRASDELLFYANESYVHPGVHKVTSIVTYFLYIMKLFAPLLTTICPSPDEPDKDISNCNEGR
jgi:hypothetical protein